LMPWGVDGHTKAIRFDSSDSCCTLCGVSLPHGAAARAPFQAFLKRLQAD
jgi:hypothetical protein